MTSAPLSELLTRDPPPRPPTYDVIMSLTVVAEEEPRAEVPAGPDDPPPDPPPDPPEADPPLAEESLRESLMSRRNTERF